MVYNFVARILMGEYELQEKGVKAKSDVGGNPAPHCVGGETSEVWIRLLVWVGWTGRPGTGGAPAGSAPPPPLASTSPHPLPGLGSGPKPRPKPPTLPRLS